MTKELSLKPTTTSTSSSTKSSVSNNSLLRCDYFEDHRCRSCSLLEFQGEQREKQILRRVQNTLTPFGNSELESFVKPNQASHSRAKAKVAVTGTLANPILGLVDRELDGIELLGCPLHFKKINEILTFLPGVISKYQLTPYDIKKRKGELKYILITANSNSSQIIVRFVLRSTEAILRLKKAIPSIQEKFNEVKVISANIQPVAQAIQEGPEESILTECKYIWDEFEGFELAFAPGAFSQVTPEVARTLYQHVAKVLRERNTTQLVDLFCGVGGFSFAASKFLENGWGVELSPTAIECANIAKTKNKAFHLEFASGSVEAFLNTFSQAKVPPFVMNPPRAGLKKEVCEKILELSPSFLVYSSCHLESLKTDLEVLNKKYRLAKTSCFDMFPLTEHVETVVILEKR